MGITVTKIRARRLSQYSELKGADDQGQFKIEIQNDCSQIRWSSGDGSDEGYMDVNVHELTEIRNFIDRAIRRALARNDG